MALGQRQSVLLTNDDGYDAPGIRELCKKLQEFCDVIMIAPSKEHSGFAAAITLGRPLKYEKVEEHIYKVDGTPADCVHMGIRHILDKKPDMVVSGINRGPNLGDDTLFSGTVGSANIGYLEGIPSIAVSMGDFGEPMRYDSASIIVKNIMESQGFSNVIKGRVLNINVPNLPLAEIKGMRLTRLSKRRYPDYFEEDRRGPEYGYWYPRGPVSHDQLEDGDAVAVEQGYVALTFIRPDYLDQGWAKGQHEWEIPQIQGDIAQCGASEVSSSSVT